jgi:S-adenosylmethionine:tRNA ribosyltransferase-isomerase
MTLGSVVSVPKKEGGVTPRELRRSQASKTSFSEVPKATCSESPIWAEPSDQRPSIPWPGPPIQKKAAPRSGTSSASARLIAPYLGSRLWVAELSIAGDVDDYLRCHGRPIRYAHTSADGGISVYQNVYSTETGSAEMPSAGRPFTPELITRLIAKGVDLAPLVLHTGVSSLERGERPLPERLHVPVSTTARVELTRRLGMRVIAVGTTTVRALESAIAEDGRIHPTNGWTDLILDRNTPLSAVDGVLSGFHDPDSSHLELLEAFAGPELIAASYRAAAERGYRRHEFGDVQLLLPRAPKGSAFD